MDDLGIEYQTVLGMPPVEFVHVAADLGCRSISMKASTGPHSPYNPYGYEPYSFHDDPALLRGMKSALAERGVTISLAEGFVVTPGADVLDDQASLDVMAGLGAGIANMVSLEPDWERTIDQFAGLSEAAAERGMSTTVEFSSSLAVKDLPSALAAVEQVGRDDFRVLIDTMHLVRSGSTAAELAAVDPARLGYVQLCDSSLQQRNLVYRDDSSDRSAPGEGELPLLDILLALPEGLAIGVEVPMRTRAAEGLVAEECARLGVAASRALLAEVSARRAQQ